MAKYAVDHLVKIKHTTIVWSNNSRGYYAKCELEGGLLLFLKSSLFEIAEFCSRGCKWEQREVINGHSHIYLIM